MYLLALTLCLFPLAQCSTKVTSFKNTPLGGFCLNDDWCGDDTLCLERRCTCELGSIADSNRVDCNDLKCKSDLECAQNFTNTVCTRKGKCSCSDSFKLEKNQCVPRFQLIGGTCRRSSDCGSSTVCAQDRCKCKMGHFPDDNQMDCRRKVCRTNADCSLFGGSECKKGECKCQPGYALDYDSQNCLRKETNDSDDEDSGLPFILILIIPALIAFLLVSTCIVLLCTCCFCPQKLRSKPPSVIMPDNGKVEGIHVNAPNAPNAFSPAATSEQMMYPQLPLDPPPPYNPTYQPYYAENVPKN